MPMSRGLPHSWEVAEMGHSSDFLSLPQGGPEGVQGHLALSLSLMDFEIQAQQSSMAPYHIRKYRENDRTRVLDVFSQGMNEHIPTTFCHILKLPRTLVLLLGVPLTLFLFSGSWVLALIASLILLAALRFLSRYPWTKFIAMSLRTDMSDITKTYLGKPGSCFWVVEAEGQVVGIMGVLPATLQKEKLQLLHLCVAPEHRGQGIAKALVRTALQFARDQGYSQVILITSMVQHSAWALYQHMGFQKTHQFFSSMICRLVAIPTVGFVYHLPSAGASEAQGLGGGP
ncbi:N-acetyltransferase 8 [Neofelis nebulosa]|uniref:N-acetyltransferase 8 n=1 Tax=Neofelis nebulosa TaxID=61452 RepID=UPI00272A201A|nr:N-acetyltransferase 8 [Neofelis nebulosa]